MPSRYNLSMEFINLQLEKKLLAAIITKPEIYWEVNDLLPPGLLTETQPEFNLIAQAIEQEKSIPAIEISEEPTPEPLAVARELARLYQKRLLADLLQNSLENLRTSSPASDMISQLETRLVQVQQSVLALKTGRVVSWPELVPQVLAEISAKWQALQDKGSTVVGLPTGLARLDRLLGGLQTGVHLLAAEPGVGKTTLMLQFAQHVAEQGYPALFVSFEESLSRLALKSLCQVAALETKAFADGHAEPGHLEKAAKAFGSKLANLHFLEGNKQVNVSQIKAKAQQLIAKSKTKQCLIVIDYIQKMAASSREFTDYRHIVANLVSDLRETAMRLDCPLVAISSQNRGGQGQAKLTSLKESGELEYSADTVMFLVESLDRRVSPPCRPVDLMIEKNRYGDKGKIALVFKPNTGSFLEEARV